MASLSPSTLFFPLTPFTASPSPPTIPTSSTFRKLPNAVLGPFRRDKPSSGYSNESSHVRGSTYPASSREAYQTPLAHTKPPLTDHLLPPSRKSSLPVTPHNSDNASAVSPTPELDHIAYPTHLATTQAPTQVPSVQRVRETTLGPIILPLPSSAVERDKSGDTSVVQQFQHGSNEASRGILPLDQTPSEPTKRRRATTTSRPIQKSDDSSKLRKDSAIRAPSAPILPTAKAVATRVAASAMYFSTVASHGYPPDQPLRAHTGTLVDERIWFLGGVDGKNCWRRMAWFDTETLLWSTIETFGQQLPPLRAHTCTLVGRSLVIFGGGDGPTYSNDVWVFDTGKSLISAQAQRSLD